MLNENIKNLRKAKGLSQEELAIKLNVVRQTVSKWEKGLSVPDSNLLISLADELDTSVSILLGETVQERRIRTIRYLLFALCAVIIVVFLGFAAMQSEYLNWDYNDPELAVAGTILHGVEFLFVRLAPFALIASIIGIIFTYKNR